MTKKDFSNVNTNSVYDTIAEATTSIQDTQEVQEEQILQVRDIVDAVLDRQEEKRKGASKGKRINMAFFGENYNYINVMSRIKGVSLTDFVNEVLDQSRERNKDTYEKAKDLLDNFNL